MTAQDYIEHLQLQPHPEGGFFKESYRSSELVSGSSLPERFAGDRSFSTAIYYLLQRGDFSAFHRIKSDECWHFYDGGTLLIHVIAETGKYEVIKLGKALSNGENLQYVVPAGAWFASEPHTDATFSLVGCTVAPGFDFNDFEMADGAALLKAFPAHSEIISRLCR
jgi:predicted cupin superfamily sugar epimerase